jgi:peroxiredoxin Q/BCP
MKLAAGDPAPDFTLPDQNEHEHTLSDYRGKWVLVYFYPRDNTPGCTQEACAFRDTFARLRRAGAVVLGISPDSVRSHGRFAEKHDLPFPLLADTDRKVVRLYGAWGKKKMAGREYMGVFRKSFLVDPEGRLAKAYEKVRPKEHAAEVLEDIKSLKKKAL